MDWFEQVYQYCERGADASFWAEPVNAVTNGAFVLAAVLIARGYRGGPAAFSLAQVTLIGLAALIGVGSFLFHTFATRWAMATDVGAIAAFTLAYLAFALRNFLEVGWLGVGAGLLAVVVLLVLARYFPCDPALLPATDAAGRPCLNGSLGYVPVLLALVAVGSMLLKHGHRAARMILAAAGVFAVSLVFRTLDIEVCSNTDVLGAPRGTHALWHLLNATVVYLLLRAATLPDPDRARADVVSARA